MKIDFRKLEDVFEFRECFFKNSIGETMLLATECIKEFGYISDVIFHSYFKAHCDINEVSKYYHQGLDIAKEFCGREMSELNNEQIEQQFKEYFYLRIISNTVTGKKKEVLVKGQIEKEFGIPLEEVSEEIDIRYGVDLEAKDFAIQVKPITYMYDGENNKNLQTHKQENKDKHKKYRERFGKPVVFVYYNADTNSYNFDEIYDRATDTGKKN